MNTLLKNTVCRVFGHRPQWTPGPIPGKPTPKMWTVNWHYKCSVCKECW